MYVLECVTVHPFLTHNVNVPVLKDGVFHQELKTAHETNKMYTFFSELEENRMILKCFTNFANPFYKQF